MLGLSHSHLLRSSLTSRPACSAARPLRRWFQTIARRVVDPVSTTKLWVALITRPSFSGYFYGAGCSQKTGRLKCSTPHNPHPPHHLKHNKVGLARPKVFTRSRVPEMPIPAHLLRQCALRSNQLKNEVTTLTVSVKRCARMAAFINQAYPINYYDTSVILFSLWFSPLVVWQWFHVALVRWGILEAMENATSEYSALIAAMDGRMC